RASRAALTASAAGAAGAILVPDLDVDFGPTLTPDLSPTPDLEATPELSRTAELEAPAEKGEEAYGAVRLTVGIAGRTVLAFVAGCLAITLLPLLIGWHPYVVKSGSMEPKIKVGDVVLASPNQDPQVLLGRVTVFQDPARPGQVKSHRVIAINPDRSLTTKGDANPTADPVHVAPAQVNGIGRLLVRWAGLPLVWAMTGQFLFLGLFVLALLAAAWAVARDHEDEDDEDDEDDDDEDRARGSAGSASRATRRRTAAIRGLVGVVGAGALFVPGTSAAFSATTKSTVAKWSVPAYSYTGTANGFHPYLYWQLEDNGATAADSSGNGRTGTYAGSYTRSVTGGTPDAPPNFAVTAQTATSCITTKSSTPIAGPSVFTEVIWFKTTAGFSGGGKLIGFETPQTGVGVAGVVGNYDRHLYLDGAGKVWFGVYNDADKTISTAASYNDGSWHMAAATISPAGMSLYVDGVLRGTNSNPAAEASTGWWRVGCGSLAGWGAEWTGPNNPGTSSTVPVNMPFLGSLDEAAIYSGTALTAADISFLYWTR
ncbi:MAG: S26 family signal peptidase, partial [Actinomycetota bacterium]|nr:S26 family signal peptidase [Actinomycetota bacterium]